MVLSRWASPMTQWIKNPHAVQEIQETWVQPLGWDIFFFLLYLFEQAEYPRTGAQITIPDHPRGKRFHHKLPFISDLTCLILVQQKYSEGLTFLVVLWKFREEKSQ